VAKFKYKLKLQVQIGLSADVSDDGVLSSIATLFCTTQ